MFWTRLFGKELFVVTKQQKVTSSKLMLKDNQFIEQVYVDELKIKKPGEYV